MKQFLQLMESEFVRVRHTQIFWIHVIIPVAAAGVFLGYYCFAVWDSAGKVAAYLQTVSCVWPFLASLICGQAAELEADAGYQNFLGLAAGKYQMFLAKWLFLLFCGFLSGLLAILGFGLCFRFFLSCDIYSLFFYFVAAFIIWLGQAVVYLLHLAVALEFGKSVSAGMGIGGMLLAFLMLTGLGDGIWMLFPWSWSGRNVSYLLLCLNRKLREDQLQEVMKNEYSICLILTVLMVGAVMMWLIRYEGRRQCEI